ncbi:hypothetical protein CLV59_10184 [Chitinophaga dinghuensis]|uniref:Uncharacterized protein n=1 Tax=Chitinophaga dinghuensis TaxID=1539050 RepID=A0A327W9Q9_9BACT|nr:hypothetical protein [Chitinophaga dinghuensis]RAJ87335.1 hypothetical protein CLV59_10184 [Chitinophaga dinghuensis]
MQQNLRVMWLSVLLMLLFGVVQAQQLRLGNLGTTATTKSAVLELASTNQGLLLTRVTPAAMAAAPLSSAPAGMIVFSTTDSSLYLRVGASWQKIVIPTVSQTYYSLAGAGTNTPITNPIKIIVDSVQNLSTGLPVVNIPSGFYTKIINIQATGAGGTNNTNSPIVTVSSFSLTKIQFAVTVGNSALVALLSGTVMDTDVTHKVYFTITGY